MADKNPAEFLLEVIEAYCKFPDETIEEVVKDVINGISKDMIVGDYEPSSEMEKTMKEATDTIDEYVELANDEDDENKNTDEEEEEDLNEEDDDLDDDDEPLLPDEDDDDIDSTGLTPA